MTRARTSSAFLLATLLLVLIAALVAPREARAAGASLTWYGHAAFSLHSPGGTVVLMDPVPDTLGYRMPRQRADAVTVSHEHWDHLALDKAEGDPVVLRGLTANGRRVREIDTFVGDVHIRAVATTHDAERGRVHGPNAVFVLETGGLSVVHLGDLGHVLDARQVAAVGTVDVLLVPVGGTFSLGPKRARRVVEQLSPRRLVVPMHYATRQLTEKLPLADAEPFLRASRRVRREEASNLDLHAAPRSSRGPRVVRLQPARATG